MVEHPLALQLRSLQSLVEIGVDKNTTVVFPSPIMTTIAELSSFIAGESAAAEGARTTPSGETNGVAPAPPRQAADAA